MPSSSGRVPNRMQISRRLRKTVHRSGKFAGRFAALRPEILEERRLLSLSMPGIGAAGSAVESALLASCRPSDAEYLVHFEANVGGWTADQWSSSLQSNWKGYVVEGLIDDHTVLLAKQGNGESLMAASARTECGPIETAPLPPVSWMSPAYVDVLSGASAFVSNEIIVALQSGLQPTDVFGNNLSDAHRLAGTDNQYVVTLKDFPSAETLSYVGEISKTNGVLWAAPNLYHRIQTTSIPNDPLFSAQWALQNTGQAGGMPDADADLPGAWDVTTGNSDVVIAVLDNGVDMAHPDLAANIFTNSPEIAGNGIDDDGNGWIDDVHGWDFFDHDANPSPTTAFDNHGTAVAGVAAAVGNNGLGVTGTAPHANIMPLKISEQFSADDPGFATTEDIAAAIYYAAGRTASGGSWRGADVLVASWDLGEEDPAVTAALDWAEAHGRGGLGTPIFCAAGNNASGYKDYSVKITEPGTWTFQWVVTADGSSEAVDPAEYKVHLAEVSLPESTTVQRFADGQLPSSWSTSADGQSGGGLWSISDDPVYLYGTSAYAARSGVLAAPGSTRLSSAPVYVAQSGALKFEAWFETSEDFPRDGQCVLQAYKDGVLVPSCGLTISPTSALQTGVAYPASLLSTIAVGASTDCDYRADYSQYGPELDFVAPSSGGISNVMTTDRTGAQGYSTFSGTSGNYMTNFGGTSAAAPLAAGIGALLLSVNPQLTAEEIRQLLRTTADKIGSVPYADSPDGTVGPYSSNEYYGYGRIDAEAAVRTAAGSLPWLILQTTTGSNEVVEGGASDRYSLVLNAPPTANVTVQLHPDAQCLAVDEAHPDRDYLTFTPDNWSVPQYAKITAVDDHVVKSSPYLALITHTTVSADPRYNALPILETTVSITDNDGAACTIGDRVFADLDRDGIQDPSETGLAGVHVALVWAGLDGQAGTADDLELGNATTTADGLYAFHNIAAGAYYLEFRLPAFPSGLAFTAPDQGVSDLLDSDVDPATGWTDVFQLSSGTLDLSHDAGVMYPGATVGDRVWNDLNGNGLQDAGEPGFGGATVGLHYSANTTIGDSDDVLVQTTDSDADGRYRFSGLNAGLNYYLTFQLPTSTVSLTFSPQGTGGGIFPETDSNVDSLGKTPIFTVSANQANLSLDAGVIESAPFHWGGVRSGGDAVSTGIGATIDDEGNVSLLGTVTGAVDLDPGSGTMLLNPTDPEAPFLAVYAPDGTPRWAAIVGRRLTADSTLQAAGMVRTSDGNLIVGGTFQGSIDVNPGSGVTTLVSPDTAAFVTRYDAYGHFLGAFAFGLGGVCSLDQIALSADGKLLLAGSFSGTVDFASGAELSPLTAEGDSDAFIAKFERGGSLMWARAYGGLETNGLGVQGLAGSPDGGAWLTGGFYGTADLMPGSETQIVSSAGGDDIYLLKVSASGDGVWATRLGGSGEDRGGGLSVDAAGNVYVAGRFTNTVCFDPQGLTGNLIGAGLQHFVAKYSSIGTFSWAHYSHGEHIAVDSRGNVYCAGAALTKFDAAGNFLWETTSGGDAPEANAVAASASGAVVDVGTFSGSCDFDPGPGKSLLQAPAEGGFFLRTIVSAPVGDRVWIDSNGNGLQDPGEPGRGGVTVELYSSTNLTVGDADDAPVGSTVTDDQGRYFFNSLLTGSHYYVEFHFSPNSSDPTLGFAPRHAGSDGTRDCDVDGQGRSEMFILAAGQSAVNIDAGLAETSVTGRLWEDLNGNGVLDPGEPGMSNGRVELYSADGIRQNTTYTDADGNYAFQHYFYVPGNYYLVFSKPQPTTKCYAFTTSGEDNLVDSTGRTSLFALTGGDRFTDFDAGLVETNVGDRVWVDQNNNGRQDDGEPGLAEAVVKLYSSGYGGVRATTTTAADGSYRFENYLFLPGDYYVTFTPPQDGKCYAFSAADVGSDGLDSDGDATGRTAAFHVGRGDLVTSVDAGLVETNVGDCVWVDQNGNGRQDDGEPGLADAVVKLYSSASSGVKATATTAADGSYRFANYLFAPGDYYVTFAPPQDGNCYAFTAADVGSDDLDSDADATGRTAAFYVGSGDLVTSVDAGLVETNVGDRVWVDQNGNGRQDVGEPGLAGAVVKLYSAGSSGVQATTTTAADGSYRFANYLFLPGNYYVTFTPPQDGKCYAFTAADVGSDDVDSDADATGRTAAFYVGRGDLVTSVDAGLVETGISGRVWNDANGDGLQTGGELGISGITAELRSAADDSLLQSVTTDNTGAYHYSNLLFQVGNYYLTFKPANGKSYCFAAQDAGDNALDSDANPHGRTAVFLVTAGAIVSHLDAGLRESSLEGRTWRDTNGDGIRGSGEAAQSGVRVVLYRVEEQVEHREMTAYTDGDGRYHFANYIFVPGDYFLEFTAPPNYRFAPAHAGTDGTLDSDVDPDTNRSSTITVSPGQIDNALDAGLIYEAPASGEIHDAGSTGMDEGRAVATDPKSGDAVIVGRFSGTINFSPDHSNAGQLVTNGLTDIFISKYSSSGDFLWAKSFGGPGDDAAFHVAVGPQGDIYLTGSYYETMDLAPDVPSMGDLVSHGGKDLFVVRFDNRGSLIWAKSYGGSDDDEGLSVALDALGNVYVGGDFRGTAQFGLYPDVVTLTSAGGTDGLVACWDGQGTFQWARRLGGDADDLVKSVAVSGTSLVAGGSFEGTAHFDPGSYSADRTSAGASDGFVLWLDTAGGWHNVFSFGDSEEDSVNALAADGQENIYAAGRFCGGIDIDPGLGYHPLMSARDTEDNFTGDVFVASFSADRGLRWAETIGGAGEDHANAICIGADNSVYLTGLYEQTVDFNPDPDAALERTSRGDGDLFAVKLDSQGNFRFLRTLGGNLKEEGFGIAVNSQQQIFTTGMYFSQAVYLDDDTSHPVGDNSGDEDVIFTVYHPPARVSGKAWNDVNHNGFYEPDEIPFAGLLVDLFMFKQASPSDPGEFVLFGQSTISQYGQYSFSPLDIGTYYVRFELPQGFAFSNPSSGRTADFQIQSFGQSVPDVDVAIYAEGVNHPPVVTQSPAQIPPTSPRTPVTDDLHNFVIDPDQDPLTSFQVINWTQHGLLWLSPESGVFNYQPDAYFYGTDSFRYRVTDYRGGSVEGEIDFNVSDITPGIIAGSAGNDVIRIVCNAANPYRADVFVNNNTTQPNFYAYFSNFYQWQITTGGGADELIVDFSQGNPLPVNGLTFNGGSIYSNAQMVIRGTATRESVTVTPGKIDVSNVTSNFPPLYYSNVTYFGFELGETGDALTLDDVTVQTSRDEALSDGIDLTLRNDAYLDLKGHGETVNSVRLENGTIADGTLHTTQYLLMSGVIDAHLSSAVVIYKTTADPVSVSEDIVAQTVKIWSGSFSAPSITADALFIGGSNRAAADQSAFPLALAADSGPTAEPSTSLPDDVASVFASADGTTSPLLPPSVQPAVPLGTKDPSQHHKVESTVAPNPSKPFAPAAIRLLGGVADAALCLLPESNLRSPVAPARVDNATVHGRAVPALETDAAILWWLADLSRHEGLLRDSQMRNLGLDHTVTGDCAPSVVDAGGISKKTRHREPAGLWTNNPTPWIRHLGTVFEQVNAADSDTEEFSPEAAVLRVRNKDTRKSGLRAIDYCHAELKIGGGREIT
jgi:hypothetical protein